MTYRYFKCNVLGGFRLSDVNKNVKQGEYFFLDSHVTETSRAVIAAIREKWMIEVSEKEAQKFIKVPKTKIIDEPVQHVTEASRAVSAQQPVKPANATSKTGVSIPNVAEVNKKLESRQAIRSIKKDELSEELPVPDIDKARQNAQERQKDRLENKKIVKAPIKENEKAENPEIKVVNSLSKEEGFDNEFLAIPKKDAIKDEVKTEIQTRVRRKKAEKVTEE